MSRQVHDGARALCTRLLTLLALGSGLAVQAGAAPGRSEPRGAAETAPTEVVHHELKVKITPGKKRIAVVDTVTLAAAPDGTPVHFLLHAGLRPRLIGRGGKLTKVDQAPQAAHFGINGDSLHLGDAVPLEHYAVTLPKEKRSFKLSYGGRIDHPLEQHGEEYARSFKETPGTIGAEGVYLAGATHWIPWLGDQLLTFDMTATLPKGWDAVSQGARVAHKRGRRSTSVQWVSEAPQDEVFISAARFVEYGRKVGGVELFAFLRSEDPALAEKYLQTTGQYIDMYRRLIGPYPYPKFALVENFWQTGYGMPSFTLLGPKIIRFPFILHSSYPHEILHNWWGNSVYVDYQSGNWCEGLTAYLADHLIKEQRGQGTAYRRTSLQKYADYVTEAKDFPLTEFRSRHSSVTQAIGYGKTLMLFHMLRRDLGDQAFSHGLQMLYSDNKFKRASFADVESAFSSAAGRELRQVFSQWVERPGAPVLGLGKSALKRKGKKWILRFELEQIQAGVPYRLKVPVAVSLEGRAQAWQGTVDLVERKQWLSIELPARPRRLDVDPEFDLMRRLDRSEIPPALSAAFGADKVYFVVPAKAPAELAAAHTALFEVWKQSQPSQISLVKDTDLERLPADGAVWLLGWDNRFRAAVAAGAKHFGAELDAKGFKHGTTALQRGRHSLVVAVRNPAAADQTVAWLATDTVAALPGLGRKLPHYGKYSYLGFEGDEPANVAKSIWPVVGSPLTAALGEGALVARAKLAKRKPLASLPPAFSAERMLADVQHLSGAPLKGRGFGSPELERSAEWIAAQFKAAGLRPAGDSADSFFQSFAAQGGEPARRVTQRNVVGVIPGSDKALAGGSVVISAHYDHLGLGWPDAHQGERGRIHPGADDNASGVAVMLELARSLAPQLKPKRSVVFVAFAGEEAGRLGSLHYVAKASRYPANKAIAAVNLDTIGRLGDADMTVLGVGTAREWIHIFFGASYVSGVPVKPITDDVGGSDQKSFTDAGVPAVQLFSGPHLDYHRPTDSADKIDADGLVKAAALISEVVSYLAERSEPLSANRKAAGTKAEPGHGKPGGRKVSLGTVPDFAFQGTGVRLSGVTPGSPAAAAGLRAGDIVSALGEHKIAKLRDLGTALRQLKAGQTVRLVYQRDGKQGAVDVTLVAR